MADRLDNATAGEEAKGAQAAAPPATSQGFKIWLPLIITMIAMPALAFFTTKFLIIPQIRNSLSSPGVKATAAAESGGESEGGEKKGEGAAGESKFTFPLSKLLVNISGTMGTRYLMTSLTLVGKTADFKDKIEANKDQLLDLASGTLSSKTISDLEKPGVRNVIRAELISVFNTALGKPLVQEIYITELAIQ